MQVVDKYRCGRQVGWSDEAEVHAGPPDADHRVPIAVKIRHGESGPARPGGNRERFLRAANDQQAAVLAGCRFIAPVFETGSEGDNAFYVTRHFQRSVDSLIQGRVAVDAAGLHRLSAGVLGALEELRDRHRRAHGNLKPTNVFLDGKTLASANAILGDLAPPEPPAAPGADCHALGAMIYQLVRGRTVRNFDWPMVHTEDWERLGPLAQGWRAFTNVLMSPELAGRSDALAEARTAFKNLRKLGAAAPAEAAGMAAGGSGAAAPVARSRAGGKGLLAGAGAALAAAGAYAVLLFQPPESKGMMQLRAAVPFLAFVLPRLPPLAPQRPTVTPVETPAPTTTPAITQATPAPEAAATPAMAEATPPPTATAVPDLDPAIVRRISLERYVKALNEFRQSLNAPAAAEDSELLAGALGRFKSGAEAVDDAADFYKKLPPKLEATGDQPDLPPNRWLKKSVARVEETPTATYDWMNTGVTMQFNRVASPGGPAFYLSATAVPLRLGLLLAKAAEADGKGPLRPSAGPVSWLNLAGPAPFWISPENPNEVYAKSARPALDSPMNGLSGLNANRLAQAAGGALPTLAQWGAVLAGPAGQQWTAQWRGAAKVRGPQWAAFAKGIDAQHLTGAKLPNDQCFGSARHDLSAVGTADDANLFYEPVNTRVLRGFAHLVGNVGQYVVDSAPAPAKYYFAGGSAESDPAVFQSLTGPPPVPNAFSPFADAGFRLAVAAKGNGSTKNPALDKLKTDLEAEIARTGKLL